MRISLYFELLYRSLKRGEVSAFFVTLFARLFSCDIGPSKTRSDLHPRYTHYPAKEHSTNADQ